MVESSFIASLAVPDQLFSSPFKKSAVGTVRVLLYIFISTLILGAFAKLRKATVIFVVSIRPSVRMKQLVSHWTDFH
jgi:hypothetical protein